MDNLHPRGEDSLSVSKVRLLDIIHLPEPNGNLAFIELPVFASRIFYIYGVKVGDVRGHHAHRECEQFLICLSGTVNITCDDGATRQVYTLDTPLKGLYIPPMVWSEQYYYSKETILVGLASHPFDEGDYIRDYKEYMGAISSS